MEKIRKIIKEVVKREIYYKKRRDLYKQSIQNLTEGTRNNFNYSLYANIWDDYYDDITGKKQETDIRVEAYKFNEGFRNEATELIYDYIKKNIDLKKVKFTIKHDSGKNNYFEDISDVRGKYIFIENMTHIQRKELLNKLVKSKLKYDGFLIEFISES